MSENKLKLNNDKTELLVLSSRQQHKIARKNINIGDCDITSSLTANNLGVIFDENMYVRMLELSS